MNFDLSRPVYFYEYGRPIKNKLHLDVSQSSYKKALEYVILKEQENKEFMEKTLEYHKNCKSRANEIIQTKTNEQKNIECEGGNVVCYKIEDLVKIIKNLENQLLRTHH